MSFLTQSTAENVGVHAMYIVLRYAEQNKDNSDIRNILTKILLDIESEIIKPAKGGWY